MTGQHRAIRAALLVITSVLAVILLALTVFGSRGAEQQPQYMPRRAGLPTAPGSYLGVYAAGSPRSYAGVTAFSTATGIRPKLVVYYSGWLEPFQTRFACAVSRHGAVPLVQIDPTDVSLPAIAAGRYDDYLASYAEAVRSYGKPVILSFGHEMNADWYSWGFQNASPAAFVTAWRHIVTTFRELGVRNVTWMWTVNVITTDPAHVPSPAPWWPGRSYVTWVGIDGYYLEPSWRFDPIFGGTVAAVRELTADPILIAETSAPPTANQPAKITDLFAGIHRYGLLGFVWFDAVTSHDYRINGPGAIAALRRGAKGYGRLTS